LALEAARSSTRGCVAGRPEGWLFPGSTEPPRATRRALTTGGTGTELGHCPDYTLNRAATLATDRPARRRLSWLAAAAAIFSAKSEVTMKSFAAAVLAATASAGSSGYLSVRVYLSPITAAVHAALKSSSVSAYDAPVRGMYGTPGAGTRTAHVQHSPPGRAALSLWYSTQAAGTVRLARTTVRRARVYVSAWTRASMKTSHTAGLEREEVTIMEASSIW
jgi:hypothetical protein